MPTGALRRAARTSIQSAVGVLVLIAAPVLNQLMETAAAGGEVGINVDGWRSIGIATLAGGMIALVSLLQNLLEDHTGSTGFLVRKSWGMGIVYLGRSAK